MRGMIALVALSAILLLGQERNGVTEHMELRMLHRSTLSIGGLRWESPARWTEFRYNAMPYSPDVTSYATYKVPAAVGDQHGADARISALHDGDARALLRRETDKVHTPEHFQCVLDSQCKGIRRPGGCGPPQEPKMNDRAILGLNVTIVAISGNYVPHGQIINWASASQPCVQIGGTTGNPHYRMLGAVAKTEQGFVLFQVIGPEKTVTAAEAEFRMMLDSIRAVR